MFSNVIRLITFTLISFLTFVLFTSPGYGQLADTPWPSFGNNAQNTGLSEYKGAQKANLKWSFETDDGVSSPVIGSDGTIYVGSDDNYLYAVNPDSTEQWSFEAEEPLTTPAIEADGTIYVGSAESSYSANLYAVNPDGTEKWRYGTTFYSDNPNIGKDGTIYVAPRHKYVYGVNPDGTEQWSFGYSNSEQSFGPSPTIGPDSTIYAGTDNDLYAVNPDGSEQWNLNIEREVKSPAIGADSTIYVGSRDLSGGILHAVDPDGSEQWSFEIEKNISSPAIGPDSTIYIGAGDLSDGYLYAVNPDGTEKWRFKTETNISTPAIGANGTIYISAGEPSDGIVQAVNPDGTELWNFETESKPSTPAIGTDGTIYVGLYHGNLYAIGGSETTDIADGVSVPSEPQLKPNYPNPFNPSTQISYDVPEASKVKLEVFNAVGKRVSTLVNDRKTAGSYTITFDAGNLPNGFYIYRMQAGDFTDTRKMTLIK